MSIWCAYCTAGPLLLRALLPLLTHARSIFARRLAMKVGLIVALVATLIPPPNGEEGTLNLISHQLEMVKLFSPIDGELRGHLLARLIRNGMTHKQEERIIGVDLPCGSTSVTGGCICCCWFDRIGALWLEYQAYHHCLLRVSKLHFSPKRHSS